MKLTYYVFFIVFTLSFSWVKAQEIKFQAGTGITFVREIEGNIKTNNNYPSFGFNAGPVIEFPVNDKLSVKTGALLQLKGFIEKRIFEPGDQIISDYKKYKFWYVDFPLLLKTGFLIGNQHFYAEFGPYAGIGIYINANQITERRDGSIVDWNSIVPVGKKYSWGVENRGTFGLLFATGTKIKSTEIGVSLDLELSNNSHKREMEDMHELKHRVISVYTTFPLAKLYSSKE